MSEQIHQPCCQGWPQPPPHLPDDRHTDINGFKFREKLPREDSPTLHMWVYVYPCFTHTHTCLTASSCVVQIHDRVATSLLGCARRAEMRGCWSSPASQLQVFSARSHPLRYPRAYPDPYLQYLHHDRLAHSPPTSNPKYKPVLEDDESSGSRGEVFADAMLLCGLARALAAPETAREAKDVIGAGASRCVSNCATKLATVE